MNIPNEVNNVQIKKTKQLFPFMMKERNEINITTETYRRK